MAAATFRFDRLIKELSTDLKPLPTTPPPFGTVFTDHMFLASHSHNQWNSLKIVPYQNLKFLPQCSIFQYASSAFESLRAFRDSSGAIRLFRPDRYWSRFQRSCKRLDGAEFDVAEAQKILEELLRVEERWIPHERGSSLYIRAALIGAIPALGAKLTDDNIFFIILSPAGRSEVKPLTLWAPTQYARTWYGATGAVAIGANYAIAMMPDELARKKGCDKVLWLAGPERFITETGEMNVFAVRINESGEKELITARLDDGLILPGITRESILEIAREEGELKVKEGRWTIDELVAALKEKRVIEVFGSGTVKGVAQVGKILYNEEWIEVPTGEAVSAKYAERFGKKLEAIQYGEIEHSWSVIVSQ